MGISVVGVLTEAASKARRQEFSENKEKQGFLEKSPKSSTLRISK